eukprot:SAG31_NODE_1406_length_8487_cov_4.584883_7_plen_78_part_00
MASLAVQALECKPMFEFSRLNPWCFSMMACTPWLQNLCKTGVVSYATIKIRPSSKRDCRSLQTATAALDRMVKIHEE